MNKDSEIKYIEFSEEAEATFGAAMQRIVDSIYSTPKNIPNIKSSPHDRQQKSALQDEPKQLQPKCFTTLTDFTKDDLVVSEIDGQLLNNIAELKLLPLQSSNVNSNESIVNSTLHTKDKNKIHSNKRLKLVNQTKDLSSTKTPRKNLPGSVRCEASEMVKLKRREDYRHIRCICPECSIELSDFFEWKAHICEVHDFHTVKTFKLLNQSSNVGDFQCNECNQLIKAPNIASEKLLYHRVSHSEKPVCFECRLCSWRHHNALTLMRHVRVHHMPKNRSKKRKANT